MVQLGMVWFTARTVHLFSHQNPPVVVQFFFMTRSSRAHAKNRHKLYIKPCQKLTVFHGQLYYDNGHTFTFIIIMTAMAGYEMLVAF